MVIDDFILSLWLEIQFLIYATKKAKGYLVKKEKMELGLNFKKDVIVIKCERCVD